MDNTNLAIAAKSGDTEAIAELYRANYGIIYRTCRRYECSRYPLEDLLQEAFFPLIRAVEAFQPESGHSFTTYLANAVKWYFSRYVKQDKNRRDLCILDSPVNKAEADSETVGELTADEAAEFVDDIDEKIDMSRLCGIVRESLEERYKDHERAQKHNDVIMSYYIHGMTYKQIAENLGCSLDNVRQMIMYALRTLRHPRNKKLYAYRDDIIDGSYRHSGLTEFRHTFTSSVEWAAIRRESKALAPLSQLGYEKAGDREREFKIPLQGDLREGV